MIAHLEPSATVSLDRRGVGRALAIGVPLSLVALLTLPGLTRSWDSVGGQPGRADGAVTVLPLIVTGLSALWLAYRPFLRAMVLTPRRTKPIRLADLHADRGMLLLTFCVPILIAFNSQASSWLALALGATYAAAAATGLEYHRRRMPLADGTKLRWSDTRLERRRVAWLPAIATVAFFGFLFVFALAAGRGFDRGAVHMVTIGLALAAAEAYLPFFKTWALDQTDPEPDCALKALGGATAVAAWVLQDVRHIDTAPMTTSLLGLAATAVFVVTMEALRRRAVRTRFRQLDEQGLADEVRQSYGEFAGVARR